MNTEISFLEVQTLIILSSSTCHVIGPGVWELRAKGVGRNVVKHKTTSTTKAIPTATHMSFVQLMKEGLLHAVISQNCDGLHRRSGLPAASECLTHTHTYACMHSPNPPVPHTHAHICTHPLPHTHAHIYVHSPAQHPPTHMHIYAPTHPPVRSMKELLIWDLFSRVV